MTRRIIHRRDLAPRAGRAGRMFIYRSDSGTYEVALQIEGGGFASREDAERFAELWAAKYSETVEGVAHAS